MQVMLVNSTEYTFGVVPQFEARKIHAIWKPILNELTAKTGITFKLVGTGTIPSFEHSFEQGKYDFAYMNPWHSITAFEKAGYVPLVRDGSRQLVGILVVRKDSGIKNISALNDEIIAFPAPNALGASLLMRAELKRLHNINFHPIYVDTHSSVYLNVVLNQTKAGGGVQSSLNKQEPIVRELLKTIYKTRPINPHPISVHPRVPKEVVQKVIQAFIDIGNDPEKKKLLEKIPMKNPIKANIQDYLILKKMNLENFYVRD